MRSFILHIICFTTTLKNKTMLCSKNYKITTKSLWKNENKWRKQNLTAMATPWRCGSDDYSCWILLQMWWLDMKQLYQYFRPNDISPLLLLESIERAK
jgi:hypothetical protein